MYSTSRNWFDTVLHFSPTSVSSFISTPPIFYPVPPPNHIQFAKYHSSLCPPTKVDPSTLLSKNNKIIPRCLTLCSMNLCLLFKLGTYSGEFLMEKCICDIENRSRSETIYALINYSFFKLKMQHW